MPELKESKSMVISRLVRNVPEELKGQNCWVVHENKIPVNVKTKRPASSSDSSTWGGFQDALNAFASNGFSGVGYCFVKPYVGVDIDKSVELNIPRQLNSYTEYSPSGQGLHIICKGEIPKALKTKGLEVYTEGRFFTVTGNRLEEFPDTLTDCTDSLKSIYNQHAKDNEASTYKDPNWVEQKLSTIEKGNIHNTTVSILGKFRRDGWSKDAVRQFMLPVIERVDGDKKAFETRLSSVYTNYRPIDIKIDNPIGQTSLNYQDASVTELLDSDATTEWVVDKLIPKNSITFISGLSETRKSWMLMDLALSAAVGEKWMKIFDTVPQKVLLIDQERAKAESTRRLRQLIAGGGLDKSVFSDKLRVMTNTTINISLDRSYEAFKKKLVTIAPSLVLVDSLVTFHGADENHRSSLQAVFERIKQMQREFDLTFVFLDHESKFVLSEAGRNKEPNAHDLIGSSGKVAAAESILTVRKNSENSSVVYHTKSTCGPAVAPFVVSVEDGKEGHTEVRGYLQ